jgi:hypothetical protein
LFAETHKTDCNSVSNTANLPFLSYQLKVPKGWECTAYSDEKSDSDTFFYWKNGDKEIALIEEKTTKKLTKEELGGFPDKEAKEPMRSIRMTLEAFLSDTGKTTNPVFQKFSAEFLPKPKAALFSKNNERVAFYTNLGMTVRKGKDVTEQSIMIYRKDYDDKFLSVGCYGLTPDEVFSLVINPVIQQ